MRGDIGEGFWATDEVVSIVGGVVWAWDRGVYYFSTQGTRRGLELVPVLLGMAFAAEAAAAALRALRSKKDMMLVVVMLLWEWKLEVGLDDAPRNALNTASNHRLLPRAPTGDRASMPQ